MNDAPQLTSIAKAWLEGVRAREANQERDTNPYVEGVKDDQTIELSIQWFGGWDEADIIYSLRPHHAGAST